MSDRDRTLLKPYLAMLRLARRELDAAQRSFDQAEQELAGSATGTDWRDRVLGGLFSIDDRRTQRFRRARDAHKAAEKVLAAATERHGKYAAQVDELLEPILASDDPGFRERRGAVLACDKALRACEELRAAMRGTDAKLKDKQQAEFAKSLRDDFLRELRSRGPAVRRLVDRAATAVEEVTGEPQPKPVELEFDVRLTDQLRRQLDVAIEEVGRWRARAEQVRVDALRTAHDTL